MISLRHRFLFIHVPKTGGNAIQGVLAPYSEDHIVCLAEHHDGVERFEVRSDTHAVRKHSTLAEYQAELGADTVAGLLTFACVRDPWERMISLYFSPHRGPVEWDRGRFLALVTRAAPLRDFVTPQGGVAVGVDPFGAIDAYLRFENLGPDFAAMLARLGLPDAPLPRRNVSQHKPHRDYYDDEMVDAVTQRFGDEIQRFGYVFEGEASAPC